MLTQKQKLRRGCFRLHTALIAGSESGGDAEIQEDSET